MWLTVTLGQQAATCRILPAGSLEKYSSWQKTYWGQCLNEGHTNGLTKVPRQGQIILGKSFRIQERLDMQSVEDDFALLGRFDPGGHHQQVEVP